MSTADVAVIGGGAIGLAVARELSGRGARVLLLERGEPGREASWAAAGMLSPLAEAAGDDALLTLALRSLDLWPAFAATLEDQTGLDLDYRTAGKLHVALDERDSSGLAGFAAAGASFGARELSPARVREQEPAISEQVVRGVFVERDHSVNPRRLCEALRTGAAYAGVDMRPSTPVAAVRTTRSAVTGVELADGGVVQAGSVVVAAGAWSGSLGGLPAPLPVRPVRGEMLAVDARTASPPGLLHRVVQGPDCYLVPRAGGQVAAGATAEDVGFQPGPTPAGIASLAAAAAALVPAFGRLPLVETWAGFRPGTPDDLPILGEDPDVRGLHYATGHYRNGILLLPVTAGLVSDAVTVSGRSRELDPFQVHRLRAA